MKIPKTPEEAINYFMGVWNPNLWVRCGPMNIYMRKNPLITIANITVPEKHQRQGHFTKFLNYCEERFPLVYIENVVNPDLFSFLEKREYLKCPFGYVKPSQLLLPTDVDADIMKLIRGAMHASQS